jgi:hypothetical protein
VRRQVDRIYLTEFILLEDGIQKVSRKSLFWSRNLAM